MKFKKSRMTSWVLVLSLIIGLLVMPMEQVNAVGTQPESANVLVNGGFEQGEDGNVPGWGPEGASQGVTLSGSVHAEGSKSLRVEDNSTTQSFGAVSDAVASSPFANVVLNVMVRPETGSDGKADLRFYDAEGKLLSIVSGLVNGPVNEWTDLRVATAAPKGSTHVRVAIYIPNEKTGTLYADNVRLTVSEAPGTVTNLGQQSIALTIMTASYGKDKNGRDVMYTVVQGDPAQFVVSDVATKEVLLTKPLVALDGSHVTAAWAITTASDNKVYAGSTPNGTLFQFDPATETMRTIGKPVASDTVIWTLVPGLNGKVYGGTGYSQSLFEYDPITDKTKVLATFKTATKEQHVRSLAYDKDRNVIYVGGADVAKLYSFDLTTNAKTTLTIPEFSGKTSVYDLQYTAGKLFVRVDPGPNMFVYDPASKTWLVKNNTAYNTRGFSPVSPDNRVFYTYFETMPDGKQQWSLHAYNVGNDTYESLGVNVKGPGIAFSYVNLNTPEFPGVTLVGLAGNSGRAFYYNLQTGHIETPELGLPPQFVELFNIGKSVDGKMLSSGFISGGGLGIYDPIAGTTVLKPSLGQVEGFASLNGKMYFGIYPRAGIFQYDINQPWNRTDPSIPNNPLKLKDLGDEQDRPVSMVGVDELNKLFIGTYPIAGKTGGALTIYDGAANTFTVKRNIVPNHSINSLLYRDGKLYMGTSDMVNGRDSKLAVYNVESGVVEQEIIPVPGKKAVTSLMWGPDGNIWGMALGVLFIYDPDTHQILYSDDKFPTADYAHTNPRLMIGKDGNVYGSIFTGYVADKTYTSKLIKIDAGTKEVTVLLEGNVEKLAQDNFGNFYFKYGSELMRYSDPALVFELQSIEFVDPPKTALSIGETYQTVLQAVYKYDKRFDVSQMATYSSSNTDAAEIDASGLITAKGKGTTMITASYENKQASFNLSVIPPIQSIEFVESEKRLIVGESFTSEVIARYSDGSSGPLHQGLTFHIKNEAVAVIDDAGRVTAKKPGSTVITASYGNLSSELKVNVKPKAGK